MLECSVLSFHPSTLSAPAAAFLNPMSPATALTSAAKSRSGPTTAAAAEVAGWGGSCQSPEGQGVWGEGACRQQAGCCESCAR